MLQKALGCLFVFGIAPVGIGGLWTKGIGQKREKILNLDVYKRQIVDSMILRDAEDSAEEEQENERKD